MLIGFTDGTLEVRKRGSGGLTLTGSFPYGKKATLSDGGRRGRPKKEVIAPRAFGYRLDDLSEDIHLLVGHSFDRPLASRSAGTLDIRDDDAGVFLTAIITPDMQEVSYVRDILASILAGLTVGLSPGFRLPPERAVPTPELVEDEDPAEGIAIIRTVLQALLYEMSIVTRPAYPGTQVEARNWTPGGVITPDRAIAPSHRAFNRWRL